MFKKVFLLAAAAAMLVLCVPVDVTASADVSASAKSNVLRVVVNGSVAAREQVSVVSNASDVVIPLRAVCEKLGAAVRWDAATRGAIVYYGGKSYSVNGVLKSGRLMVKAETVADIFELNAWYDASLNTVAIGGSKKPSASGLKSVITSSNQYSAEDIYWLSRIAEAEAGGESYDSRLAVANVVLNRKACALYPDTVKEVIFDRKHGVQFTPVANGAVYNQPSQLSFIAALDALDGYNNVPGALFFMDPSQARTLWIEDNRQMAFTVGAHTYYY